MKNKHTVSKLLLLFLLSLLLGAYLVKDPGDKKGADEREVANIEVLEKNIVSSKITRFFKPKVTELRVLTEKDHHLYDIIMTRLNESDGNLLDREIVYKIANEHGEDPETFYYNWLEIVNSEIYGNGNTSAILPMDMEELQNDVIYSNIVGDSLKIISGETNHKEIDDTLRSKNKIIVDGEEYELYFKLKFTEEYSKAELVEFNIDGEEKLSNHSEADIIASEELKNLMMKDIDNKILEGYKEISIEEIDDLVSFEITEVKYLPVGFEKYGVFIRDNPGKPELKMINQIWYDSSKNEVLTVIQMEGAPITSSEGEFLFTESLESQATISDIYSWAKYRCQYEFIENEVSVQGYMLVNDSNNIDRYEKILKSLETEK